LNNGGEHGKRVNKRTGEDIGALLMKLKDKFSDAAKITAAPTDGPEEVWMGGRVDGEDGSIGGNERDLIQGQRKIKEG